MSVKIKDLIIHCSRILQLLDEIYPNQKKYPSAINKIYFIVSDILQDAT